jgi:hypothetical protein
MNPRVFPGIAGGEHPPARPLDPLSAGNTRRIDRASQSGTGISPDTIATACRRLLRPDRSRLRGHDRQRECAHR